MRSGLIKDCFVQLEVRDEFKIQTMHGRSMHRSTMYFCKKIQFLKLSLENGSSESRMIIMNEAIGTIHVSLISRTACLDLGLARFLPRGDFVMNSKGKFNDDLQQP